MRSRLLAAALACVPASLAAADPSVAILPLGFGVAEFRGPSSRVAATIGSTDAFRSTRPALAGPLVAVWGPGGSAVLSLAGGEVRIVQAARGGGDFAALERGRSALPASRIAAQGPLQVQLEGPTRDYPHEALGSAIHASTLAVAERRPAPPTSEPKPVATDTTRIPAGEEAVFEDREPRLVDLDGDGTPEILVVRSYRDRGSALAVAGRRNGAWAIVAETLPDGEPFRWLNPVMPSGGLSAGGLTAGGMPGTIVLVRRPHLDGVLQVWRFAGDRLTLAAERPGYANHVFGSNAQDLAGLTRRPDGMLLVAVPTLDRHALALLTYGSEIAEIGRIPLPARAASGVAILGAGRDLHILVGLEDGRVADVRP